jgi:hypothetical protein
VLRSLLQQLLSLPFWLFAFAQVLKRVWVGRASVVQLPLQHCVFVMLPYAHANMWFSLKSITRDYLSLQIEASATVCTNVAVI